jgi:hypothetical protein
MLSMSVHCYGGVDNIELLAQYHIFNHLTYISFNKCVIVGFTYKQYADTRNHKCENFEEMICFRLLS